MNWHELVFFGGFLILITGMLLIDLLFIGRKSHIIGFKEAFFWTVTWIALSLLFYFVIRLWGDWFHKLETFEDIQHKITQYKHPISIDGLSFEQAISLYRRNLALEYLTGYFIEKALSIDNIFVMIMVFSAFNVREIFYKRVLFWGILGAVVLRFIFIFTSSALIQRFDWLLYVFGLFLIYTGGRMFLMRNKQETVDVQHHPVVRFASKIFNVFPRYVNEKFFVKPKGSSKIYITPLFIVLLVIEFMDVMFAVDSIPAIFSITKDPYMVFFSNIFAIIGLRALFFMLIHVMNKFHYLKTGLSVLLVFIGGKMLLHDCMCSAGFTTAHSLIVVLGIITLSIILSLMFPKDEVDDQLPL